MGDFLFVIFCLCVHPSSTQAWDLLSLFLWLWRLKSFLINHRQVIDPGKGSLKAGERGAGSVDFIQVPFASRWVLFSRKEKGGVLQFTWPDRHWITLSSPFLFYLGPQRLNDAHLHGKGTSSPKSNAILLWISLYKYTNSSIAHVSRCPVVKQKIRQLSASCCAERKNKETWASDQMTCFSVTWCKVVLDALISLVFLESEISCSWRLGKEAGLHR